MIKRLLAGTALLTTLCSSAQFTAPTPYVIPNKDWIQYYSDRGAPVSAPSALDINSNVYSTGYTGLGTSANLAVLKYDSTGVLKYSYLYNNGGFDNGTAIKIDAAGYAYVAGVSDGASGTHKDIVVIKLSPTGVQQWATRYDFLNYDDEAVDLWVNSSGDIFVTGKCQDSGNTNHIVTLKLNNSGTIVWSTTYSGSSMGDEPTAITGIDASGNLFVSGFTSTSLNGRDAVVFCLSMSSGTQLWNVPTNGPGSGHDRANALVTDGTDIVMCGEVLNSSSNNDYYVAKYKGSNGSLLWQNQYDYNSQHNRATAIARDSAGNFAVTGTGLNGTIYKYCTVIYNNNGTQLTTANVENTGLTALSVDPKIAVDTIAHHWYVCGEIENSTKDMFIYQITPTGNTAWRQYIDGQNMDWDAATSIGVNGVGVVYVGGMSKNAAAKYDFTTVKLNQTPVYFPPDYTAEPVNPKFTYIPNRGQLLRTDSLLAKEVLYYTHNTKPEIFVEQNAFNFVYKKTSGDTVGAPLDTCERMQVKFLNANPLASPHEFIPRVTSYNYFLGYAASPQITNLKAHERIFIPNFYPYVDLHYFSGKDGIKFYLVLKPSATLKSTVISIDGAVSTAINPSTGRLELTGQLGSTALDQPIAYTVNWLGQVVPVSGSASWTSLGSNQYAITPPVGYNTAMPLIIQVGSYNQLNTSTNSARANFDYSTYYGSAGNDVFNDIETTPNGNRYITGYTDSPLFPSQNAVRQYVADKDVVAMKYTADDSLRFATFLGGLSKEVGNSIAINSNGDVFIGGQTASLTYPVQGLIGASNQNVNGYSSTIGDYNDGFFTRLTNDGSGIIWSRFYGGNREDAINSIYIDAANNLYYAGYAFSPDINMVNASQGSMGTWLTTSNSDAIFGKFDSNQHLTFSTYFGGVAAGGVTTITKDVGMDVTADANGQLIGVGWTDCTDLPVVNNTGNSNVFYQNTRKGRQDGFMVVYNSTGTKRYASYFGGNDIDQINRVTIDPTTNNIYFAGESYSGSSFPFMSAPGILAHNSQYSVNRNAFIASCSGPLTKEWCTYVGHGTGRNYNVTGLKVDNTGRVYLSGYTNSDSLERPINPPVTNVYIDSTRSGTDGFVTIFGNQKQVYHSHYFGGSGTDMINNCSIGQKLYVTGQTESSDFPIAYNSITAGLIDSTYNSNVDGFISRFGLGVYQYNGLKTNQMGSDNIKLYPNPVMHSLHIELNEQPVNESTARVYDITGRLIHTQILSNSVTIIPCYNWQKGVYLVTVNNNGEQSTFKVIKE